MKKGQIEVIGLVIIVIIIVFAAILFLRLYVASSSALDNDDSLLLSAKANNLANTLKGLYVCNSDMQEAIIACCIGEVFCGREACGFVTDVASSVTNLTLSSENMNMVIKDSQGKTCVAYDSGRCAGSSASSSPSPIKGSVGSADIYIKICKK